MWKGLRVMLAFGSPVVCVATIQLDGTKNNCDAAGVGGSCTDVKPQALLQTAVRTKTNIIEMHTDGEEASMSSSTETGFFLFDAFEEIGKAIVGKETYEKIAEPMKEVNVVEHVVKKGVGEDTWEEYQDFKKDLGKMDVIDVVHEAQQTVLDPNGKMQELVLSCANKAMYELNIKAANDTLKRVKHETLEIEKRMKELDAKIDKAEKACEIPPTELPFHKGGAGPCVRELELTEGSLPANKVTEIAGGHGWGVGGWGGWCTCPDGQVYQVGDNQDSCGSLACIGGTAGDCFQENNGPWSHRKVECATTSEEAKQFEVTVSKKSSEGDCVQECKDDDKCASISYNEELQMCQLSERACSVRQHPGTWEKVSSDKCRCTEDDALFKSPLGTLGACKEKCYEHECKQLDYSDDGWCNVFAEICEPDEDCGKWESLLAPPLNEDTWRNFEISRDTASHHKGNGRCRRGALETIEQSSFEDCSAKCKNELLCKFFSYQKRAQYCIRVTTASPDVSWAGGTLDVEVDAGSGYIQEAIGNYYAHGSVVLDKCFATPVLGIKIRNPTVDGWAGSVKYSRNAGSSYAAMQCTNCKQLTSTEIVYADGNLPKAGAAGSEGYANCINGAVCDIIEAETTLLEAPAANGAEDAGVCQIFDDHPCTVPSQAIPHSIYAIYGLMSAPFAIQDMHVVNSPPKAAPKLLGCFGDDSKRAFDQEKYGDKIRVGKDEHSITACASHCEDYKFMAVQDGDECFCGNDYKKEGKYREYQDTECTGKNEYCPVAAGCGGRWKNSIYDLQPQAEESRSGAMSFRLECAFDTKVSFEAEVIAPSGTGVLFGLKVGSSSKQDWRFKDEDTAEDSSKWEWSDESPSFDIDEGSHDVILSPHTPDVKIRSLKVVEGATDCYFEVPFLATDAIIQAPFIAVADGGHDHVESRTDGSITFKLECDATASVSFEALVKSPSTDANSLYIQIEGPKSKWSFTSQQVSDQFTWSSSSPVFEIAGSGTYEVKLTEDVPGWKIRALSLRDGQEKCRLKHSWDTYIFTRPCDDEHLEKYAIKQQEKQDLTMQLGALQWELNETQRNLKKDEQALKDNKCQQLQGFWDDFWDMWKQMWENIVAAVGGWICIIMEIIFFGLGVALDALIALVPGINYLVMMQKTNPFCFSGMHFLALLGKAARFMILLIYKAIMCLLIEIPGTKDLILGNPVIGDSLKWETCEMATIQADAIKFIWSVGCGQFGTAILTLLKPMVMCNIEVKKGQMCQTNGCYWGAGASKEEQEKELEARSEWAKDKLSR